MKISVASFTKRNEGKRGVGTREILCGIAMLALVSSGYTGQAATFDVAADFSTTNNPNGSWSYGWSTTLTSAFNLYPNNGKLYPATNIDHWVDLGHIYAYAPQVAHNGTAGTISFSTARWQAGQFSLHPGYSGEYSHARWTAPYAGKFNIDSKFTGIDTWGTTTDVHVLRNGVSLFDGAVSGYGGTSSFTMTILLEQGDIIDFAVGYGSNHEFRYDSTALAAKITFIPAPAPGTFDVAADFSTTNNPNGAWSYGYSSTLTSAIKLYPDSRKIYPATNIDNWVDLGHMVSYSPQAGHNGTPYPITFLTATWQPEQFSLHPGSLGEYSHALWTAPYGGIFDISATFTGIDFRGPTTTDVHVLHNGASLFYSLVSGYGKTATLTTSISADEGDVVDFAVGRGSNQTYFNDSTALAATIVPQPPIAARVGIYPETLNLQSNGKWITCFVSLPADVNMVDVNLSTVLLNNTVNPEWTRIVDGTHFMMAKFSRSAVQAILEPGLIELTISGRLNNGARFEGKDTIRVIDKGKP